jgi:hypothetical protein
MITLNVHAILGWLFLALVYFLPGFIFAKGPTFRDPVARSGREVLAWTLLFWWLMLFYIPFRMSSVLFEIICEGWGPYWKRKNAERDAKTEQEIREWLGPIDRHI